MARLSTTFNAQEHDTEQRNDFPELPAGIYQLEVTASEVAATSTGSGTILKTTMSVIAPEEFKGRLIFNNYNLENANAQAQEIGKKQLASLCRAIGLSTVEDSEELHLRAFTAKIGLGKPSKDGKYPARAEIKRYYFEDEGDVPAPEVDASQPVVAAPANDNKPAARPAAAAAAPAAGGARRPWGSK